jgi:hypothetical protein
MEVGNTLKLVGHYDRPHEIVSGSRGSGQLEHLVHKNGQRSRCLGRVLCWGVHGSTLSRNVRFVIQTMTNHRNLATWLRSLAGWWMSLAQLVATLAL